MGGHKVSKVHIEIKLVDDETAGEGIKKTPGYETNLTPSSLEQWRHDFWGKWKQASVNWNVNDALNLVESKFGLADADVWEVIEEASKLDHELA